MSSARTFVLSFGIYKRKMIKLAFCFFVVVFFALGGQRGQEEEIVCRFLYALFSFSLFPFSTLPCAHYNRRCTVTELLSGAAFALGHSNTDVDVP